MLKKRAGSSTGEPPVCTRKMGVRLSSGPLMRLWCNSSIRAFQAMGESANLSSRFYFGQMSERLKESGCNPDVERLTQVQILLCPPRESREVDKPACLGSKSTLVQIQPFPPLANSLKAKRRPVKSGDVGSSPASSAHASVVTGKPSACRAIGSGFDSLGWLYAALVEWAMLGLYPREGVRFVTAASHGTEASSRRASGCEPEGVGASPTRPFIQRGSTVAGQTTYNRQTEVRLLSPLSGAWCNGSISASKSGDGSSTLPGPAKEII